MKKETLLGVLGGVLGFGLVFGLLTAAYLSVPQVNYVKLTAADVVGAWEFSDHSWLVFEADGTVFIDPILVGGDHHVPFEGTRSLGAGAVTGTWSLEPDGQVDYVSYQASPSTDKALLTAPLLSTFSGLQLYGCPQDGKVVLNGQIDPDDVCDTDTDMTRVDVPSWPPGS